MQTDWVAGSGIVGFVTTAGLLIWRIVRLGMDQEERLLSPCYDRIHDLENRITTLETEQRRCQRDRARAVYLLRVNGIEFEESVK